MSTPTKTYIDINGLGVYDEEIKNYIASHGGGGGVTYTLSADTDNDQIVLTPSVGSAQHVTVPYATDAGTVDGKTVGVNVPSDAVFTDTDTIAELTDTTITSPTDGQVLTYDSSSSKWINANGGGGGASDLDDLDDVTISSATNGQVLAYNSSDSKWENTSLGTAASKDVPVSGNAGSSQVVLGNDSRLSDSRTPLSHTHTKSQITDFPTLATVATSGSYNDLSNKPTIPDASTLEKKGIECTQAQYDAWEAQQLTLNLQLRSNYHWLDKDSASCSLR